MTSSLEEAMLDSARVNVNSRSDCPARLPLMPEYTTISSPESSGTLLPEGPGPSS